MLTFQWVISVLIFNHLQESPTHTPPSKTPGNRASYPPATSDQSAAPYGSSLPMVIPPMVVPTLTNLPPDVIETEESYEDSNLSTTCGRSRDDSFGKSKNTTAISTKSFIVKPYLHLKEFN